MYKERNKKQPRCTQTFTGLCWNDKKQNGFTSHVASEKWKPKNCLMQELFRWWSRPSFLSFLLLGFFSSDHSLPDSPPDVNQLCFHRSFFPPLELSLFLSCFLLAVHSKPLSVAFFFSYAINQNLSLAPPLISPSLSFFCFFSLDFQPFLSL